MPMYTVYIYLNMVIYLYNYFTNTQLKITAIIRFILFMGGYIFTIGHIFTCIFIVILFFITYLLHIC